MDQQQWMNLVLFFAILLGAYFVFRYFKFSDYSNIYKEGLENNESSETSNAGPNGIAGNGSTYLTQLKQATILLKDKFNLNNSEYRKNTEDIIIEMDKLLGYITLETILTTNKDNPQLTIGKLSQLAQARLALNNALKFVDKE
jgi:hypothetical protein